MILVLISLLVMLILGSALVSASETALFSLSPAQIDGFAKGPHRGKIEVAKLLQRPRDLLITLIMINVTLNVLVQNVVSNIFGDSSGWLLDVGVPIALVLVFGEFIPKSIGMASNMQLSPKVAPFLATISQILLPIRLSLMKVTSFISRVMFFFLQEEMEISADELQHVLRTSRANGILAEDEAELMRGYLHLQESSAKEFLRPREEVLSFEIENEPLSKLIHLFVDQECTRIPVCQGGMDQILGIMTSGNYFIHRDKLKQSKDILPFLIKPFYIPESISAKILLDQMYEQRQSLAIVVDEYGTVSGLLSIEDLVETVVGEIFDRRDEKARYTRSGEDVIIASGKLELLELENIFDISLESAYHAVTIGGWLTEKFGDIPKGGEKYTYKHLLFHVLSSDQKRVKRVYIRRLPR